MENFFNYDNIAYNIADFGVRSGYATADIHSANESMTLGTLGLTVMDGTAAHLHTMGNQMAYPQSRFARLHTSVLETNRIHRVSETRPLEEGFDSSRQQYWPTPHWSPVEEMSISTAGIFGRTDEMTGVQVAPIYPSSMQNTNVQETQWQMPVYPESSLAVLNASFNPSSSSLAGALGRETGPYRSHTSRVVCYAPYHRTRVAPVHENGAGPSGLSQVVRGGTAPVVLPTLTSLNQIVEADAEETIATTEEDQDTVSFSYCPCILQLIACFVRR
ncbi:hypothetical protein BDM02DRAFT_992617 [Thelephora ganbajun]|uniref:Uncharacterized protein n=1 Tax=Thelephora ganbajun TaxID=370292 RepID=A0ACB6Z426_THEGA|nr:hypothetical protein BDM02DRAFT_992617 [Thelephora ganbajun]